MADEKSGGGFFAMLVLLTMLIVGLNFMLFRFVDEKKPGEQWGILQSQIDEAEIVLSAAAFDEMADLLPKIRDAAFRYVEPLAKMLWCDFTMVLLIRSYLAVNMIPLFIIVLAVGLIEGLVVRNRKALSFGGCSVIKFQAAKKALVLITILPIMFYISFPFQFLLMIYGFVGVIFSLATILTYVIVSELPTGI